MFGSHATSERRPAQPRLTYIPRTPPGTDLNISQAPRAGRRECGGQNKSWVRNGRDSDLASDDICVLTGLLQNGPILEPGATGICNSGGSKL